ncbi:MAG: outer membrane lipoprotein carrier protein LolA [Candidatus Accumulibacter sp.]|jgi:hypothetical protein|nr:outer membrane lipoprotein carrier protein LolA [Accumulibacter sp.]
MKKAVFFFLLLCLDAWAVDDASLARIAKSVEQAPVIRANFEQIKTIRSLKRPLRLSGRLVFSRRHGVLWAIEYPYRMTYVLGEERVVEIGGDGTRRERASSELSGFAQTARIFRALLSAETQVLKDYFDARGKTSIEREGGEPISWELSLLPKREPLARFLSGMRVSGSRFIESLVIDEALGDRSEIRFSGARGDVALSEDEQALFEGTSQEKP